MGRDIHHEISVQLLAEDVSGTIEEMRDTQGRANYSSCQNHTSWLLVSLQG